MTTQYLLYTIHYSSMKFYKIRIKYIKTDKKKVYIYLFIYIFYATTGTFYRNVILIMKNQLGFKNKDTPNLLILKMKESNTKISAD